MNHENRTLEKYRRHGSTMSAMLENYFAKCLLQVVGSLGLENLSLYSNNYLATNAISMELIDKNCRYAVTII